MTPTRSSPNGSYMIDRRFQGVGRIHRASGTTSLKRWRAFNTMLTELDEDGNLGVLRALRDGTLTFKEVYAARREGRVSYVASDLVVRKPLWDAVDEWVPTSADAESTRKRYETSWAALREHGPFRDDATVRDLARIDWRKLKRTWPNSGADWNRMRAAVSRFLTMALGNDKLHPFRREVMKEIPRARERERVPDIDAALFNRLVDKAPDYLEAAYMALVITGLRVGEYLALEEHHLMPHTRQLAVPGTKTEASADTVGPFSKEDWSWIVAAVPSPLAYKWLRINFKRAAKAVGAPGLRLNDLRHLHGMLASAGGLSDATIAASLRHANVSTTRRYTKRRAKGEVARVVGDALRRGE